VLKESRPRPWNFVKASTETLSVVVEREVPFPPEEIWRALAQPHLIEGAADDERLQACRGSRFSLRADWGTVDCQVLAVEPNKPLSYSWVPMILKVR
jgi:uncharacterized protein YndB with AHSA1/START domain